MDGTQSHKNRTNSTRNRNVAEKHSESEKCVSCKFLKRKKINRMAWKTERKQQHTTKCRWLICWDVIVDRDKYFFSCAGTVHNWLRFTFEPVKHDFSLFSFSFVWWHTHWTACPLAATIGDSIPAICLYLLNARFSVFTPLMDTYRALIEFIGMNRLNAWAESNFSKMRRVSSRKQFDVSVCVWPTRDFNSVRRTISVVLSIFVLFHLFRLRIGVHLIRENWYMIRSTLVRV